MTIEQLPGCEVNCGSGNWNHRLHGVLRISKRIVPARRVLYSFALYTKPLRSDPSFDFAPCICTSVPRQSNRAGWYVKCLTEAVILTGFHPFAAVICKTETTRATEEDF